MKAATCSRVMAERSMAQTLIRLRLNEVMARHGIRAKELAKEMEVSPSAISNLRKRNMPRLTEETLDKLCRALNKLSQEKSLITPGDLIEYTPDLEPPNPKQEKNDGDQEVATAQEKLKQSKDSIGNTLSSKRQPTRSLLSVIPQVPESA